jgi:2-dehydro-3-deoxyphosphogluconate aldolase / (4S)-4-hydroxy-2-oxoglutarate aldolase
MNTSLLHAALKQKILPVVTFSLVGEVLPTAEAILKGGLHVMEVPFRTGMAIEAIAIIRKHFPEMYIGAGTLLSILQVKQAMDAGALFGLSPGFNPAVCQNAIKNNFPFIPGVMTPSEIELAAEMEFRILKLFPASQLDGPGFLKALQSPYEQLHMQFIPMGGVTVKNMGEYLKLSNVIAVGGSWLANMELIAAKQFDNITEQVEEALILTR